ncbi:hypothetical protein QN277_008357 [Acacia crassicarpa]|uniref:Uncharacterized protein n=1 Tax=Acacia crassicarpa TaxID=499986 RepID=A0AAE1IR70_9FABA|nr:hypothetical protein QN277_008357 [Acacia crassicarpa]
MGNCLIRNNQISAQDDGDDDNYVIVDEQRGESEVDQEKKKTITSGASFESEEGMKKKKRIKKKVRFELQEGDGNEEEGREGIRRKSGFVRIKLVVTQKELKRILSHENGTQQQTTLEELLSSVKLRGSRRICEVIGREDDGGAINAWRPALESISEDQ